MAERAKTGAGATWQTPSDAPRTCVDRGAVVPFTAPALVGTRVRPGRGERLELIVEGAAGRSGLSVLTWDGILAMTAPTVHDRVLVERIHAPGGPTPRTIRRASLQTAREGLAGCAAAEAARATLAADRRLLARSLCELLMMLVRQTGGATDRRDGFELLREQARQAVGRVVQQVGREPDAIILMLEALAELFAPLGIGASASEAPAVVTLAALDRMRGELVDYMEQCPPAEFGDAELILAGLDPTLAGARAALEAAAAMLANLPALLRTWVQAPGRIEAMALHPEWLLDGWKQIWLIWDDDPDRKAATLGEMAGLVPSLPQELARWIVPDPEMPSGSPRPGSLRPGSLRPGPPRSQTLPRQPDSLLPAAMVRSERLHARAMAVA